MEQQTQASTQVSHRGYWGYEEIDPASLKKIMGGDGGGGDAGDAGGASGCAAGYGCGAESGAEPSTEASYANLTVEMAMPGIPSGVSPSTGGDTQGGGGFTISI